MPADGLLLAEFLGKPMWMWALFFVLVLSLLVFDLGVLHRRPHEIRLRESVLLSCFYVSLGVLYGVWVWISLSPAQAYIYWTGFVVEKTLSLDNLFVMATIFAYFNVPRMYQHRVLFWGILGVVVLRGIMISAGSALVEQFSWLLYLFAAFLIFAGVKLFVSGDEPPSLDQNPVLLFLRKRMRLTEKLHGSNFFVRHPDQRGVHALHATPLLMALILIEVADIIFAVDSIPAILIITTDPYLVYTSNIMAILGLRAMYFMLSALMERFHYLKYALGVLLIFIGAKVFVADLLGLEHFPPSVSLGVTFAILAGGVTLSMVKTRRSIRETG